LKEDFDVPGISRFVLGPYWRGASKEQRHEFQRLLEDYLVRFYGQRFARYGGERLEVTGSRSDASGALVTSEILRPYGPAITVLWRLDVRDGHYRISDVSVDGVSMALTQRTEFDGIIERNGGQIAALLTTMREDAGGGWGSSTPSR
jgi:phospholipid transport system substrate-binding protein